MTAEKTCLTDGSSVTPGHKEIDPSTGMQKGYVVLSPEERAKGFVRPLRMTYRHVGVRPKHPLRDLTEEELERYKQLGYIAFEAYPESETPLTGHYWTEDQLHSGCRALTLMGLPLAETYARQPDFYGGTFCCNCRKHFSLAEFVWEEDGEVVGS